MLGVLALSACGGAPQRAAMPDVASTDASADELGLPSAEPDTSTEAAPGAIAIPESDGSDRPLDAPSGDDPR